MVQVTGQSRGIGQRGDRRRLARSIYSANGFYVRGDLLRNKFPNRGEPETYWRPLDYEAIVNFPKR